MATDTEMLDWMIRSYAVVSRFQGKYRISVLDMTLTDWCDDPRTAIAEAMSRYP